MKYLVLLAALWLQIGSVYAQPSDAYLLGRMQAEKIPAASFVIIKDGHWLYNSNLGKADIANNKTTSRHHMFLLSSVSNVAVATAVMQQWQKGAINLDININNYLPFQLVHPAFPADSITMRMILTNTAATNDAFGFLGTLFVNGDSPVPLDSFVNRYFKPGGDYYNASTNFQSYAPGTAWSFCNASMTLAAYVVERVTGDKFSHYCDTAIFDKLCMKNTSYFLNAIPDTNIVVRPYKWTGSNYEDHGLNGSPLYPALQLRASITSLARLMDAYMQHGKYKNGRILDSTTVVMMMQQHTGSLWAQTNALLYQGLGFYTRKANNGDTIWGQEGTLPGCTAAMYFNYTRKTGVIMLANALGQNNPLLMMDTLYKYGVTTTPTANDTFPACDEYTTVANIVTEPNELNIYPNPATGIINIQINQPGKMVLTDIQGRVKETFLFSNGMSTFHVAPQLSQGIYFAQVYSVTGELLCVRKIVFQ